MHIEVRLITEKTWLGRISS